MSVFWTLYRLKEALWGQRNWYFNTECLIAFWLLVGRHGNQPPILKNSTEIACWEGCSLQLVCKYLNITQVLSDVGDRRGILGNKRRALSWWELISMFSFIPISLWRLDFSLCLAGICFNSHLTDDQQHLSKQSYTLSPWKSMDLEECCFRWHSNSFTAKSKTGKLAV